MKKLGLLLLLFVSSTVCYAGVGYDYHDRQHITITFTDGKQATKDAEHIANWTEFIRIDDVKDKYHYETKNVKDENYICIYDEYFHRGFGHVEDDMVSDYTDLKDEIKKSGHIAIMGHNTELDKNTTCSYWHTVFVCVLKNEVKDIEIT